MVVEEEGGGRRERGGGVQITYSEMVHPTLVQ